MVPSTLPLGDFRLFLCSKIVTEAATMSMKHITAIVLPIVTLTKGFTCETWLCAVVEGEGLVQVGSSAFSLPSACEECNNYYYDKVFVTLL